MAESLAIIGLVSNILSFIDFGIKFVSGTRSVRDSLHGTTAELRELELIVEDVEKYNEQVEKQQASGQKLSGHEKRILEMVKQCRAISEELHKAIDRLHVRQGRSKTLESSRVFFQSFWRQRDIISLQARLQALDMHIRQNIERIIRSDYQSALSTGLEEVKKAQKSLAMDYDAKLDQIRDEILALVGQDRRSEHAIQMAQLASLITKFDALGKEHMACTKQTTLLKSLYFQTLQRRWSQIPKADKASNTWIFDTSLTPFIVWLDSTKEDDGLFCIEGKAGSGKSTLMKSITEDPRTFEHLRKWAGPTKLCTASYYFWNQGFEMQKSQLGLFQSLLYQILKSLPRLIDEVCPSHLEHEEWDVAELKAIFARIATQKDLEVKFCFFIDGLDEYNGAEEDVVDALKFLSTPKDIKICASTRPRSVFDKFFNDKSRTFDIKGFTKEDMGRHIQLKLGKNENFQRLKDADFNCKSIMTVITDRAQGVWLWVFLITRDLVHAVNRDEGVEMLWKIVNLFPADLKAYFERMFKAVKPPYLEEMSRILLIAVDQYQPLPLYAFSLLESVRKNPAYATNLPIRPIRDNDLRIEYPKLKSLIHNRCSDLLVVNDEERHSFMGPTVDFLHRTVADFLQDNYHSQLRANLKTRFNSKSTLCKMCLVMLKSLPDVDIKDPPSINKVIRLTDELLYYAYETEQTEESPMSSLVEVLDEVDRVNIHHTRGMKNHWTHARRIEVSGESLVSYREGDNCNFLARAVQARLVKYVRAKLDANPNNARKDGRPLLDYALRPYGREPFSVQHQSRREDPGVSVDMVLLLLERGADPNQPVHRNDGKSVWQLFLLSMYRTKLHDPIIPIRRRHASAGLIMNAWYRSCELLVQHGARRTSYLVKSESDRTLDSNLEYVFGSARANALKAILDEKEREEQQAKSACKLM